MNPLDTSPADAPHSSPKQAHSHIAGPVCAPFTPFAPDGALHLQSIAPYMQMLSQQGFAGLFINGSTGEGLAMSDEERMACTEAWLEAAPATCRVIVHVGAASVASARRLAIHAQEKKAWAIAAMGPAFPRGIGLEGLVRYCREIAGAASLPFYYYHIPELSGVHLSMSALLRAVDGEIDTFAGIKFTAPDLFEYAQCVQYADRKFDLLHGQDETMLAALALADARGFVGGTFNYCFPIYRQIMQHFSTGDLTAARQAQGLAIDIIDIIRRYGGNIVAGKQIMKLIGLDLGPNRAPWSGMSRSELDAMAAELEALGFFQYCNNQNTTSSGRRFSTMIAPSDFTRQTT